MSAALAAERALLGTALLYGRRALAAAGDLDPADFAHPLHGRVWTAVRTLDASEAPIDVPAVAESLRPDHGRFRAAVGAADAAALPAAIIAWLVDMQDGATVPDSARHHAQTVRDRATLQRLAEYGQTVAAAATREGADLGEALAHAESALLSLTLRGSGPAVVALRDALRSAVNRIGARHDAGGAITGVMTGLPAFDHVTAGLQPGHLVIVAGRPGMGKTAAAMGFAIASGVPALVFSLEMDEGELTERALASEARIDSSGIRTGRMSGEDWQKITRGASRLHAAPVEICDRPALRIGEIRAVARRWRMRCAEGHGLVLVDYLQLIRADKRGRDANREQEIADVSRSLKALARELRVPVVALAQLNRACEQRADKRPMLSDLRESGGIEQDADLVAFLYRDEVYTGDKSIVPGTAEIILRKNRHGAISTIPVWFRAESVRFDPMNGDDMRRYAESLNAPRKGAE